MGIDEWGDVWESLVKEVEVGEGTIHNAVTGR